MELTKDNKILALGESAHGAGTIFDLKTSIIKKLVLKYNYTNIVFESSFWGTQTMNKFIHNENVNINDAFQDMGVGIWITNEVYELMKWLRTYNLNKSENQRVKLYGCDVWSITSIAAHFKSHPWVLKSLSTPSIQTFDSLSNYSNWKKSRIGIKRTKMLYKDFQKNYKPNTFATIEENYIVSMLQSYLDRIKFKKGFKGASKRDEIMARTIIYLDDKKPKEKFIIWAHNAHISKSRNSTFIYPMGAYLKAYFGNNYKSLAISFVSGEVRSYNKINKQWENLKTDLPIKNSIEEAHSNINTNITFINLDDCKNENKWTNKIYIRAIGDRYNEYALKYYYSKQKLFKCFNGLIIIKTVKPTNLFISN
jgi:erythromycin esterase